MAKLKLPPEQVSSPMGSLLAKTKSKFKILHKGDVIDGVITKLTPQEILVDIQAKTEAVVLEKDSRILRSLLSTLKEGDVVQVYVLNAESDSGNPVVSLRKFSDDKNWLLLENLKTNRETLDVTVREITKGGILVDTSFGVSGFLPNSQLISQTLDAELIGKKLSVYISELNRPSRKIIFSEKRSVGNEEFEEIAKQFEIGQKIDTTIATVTSFGIFVSLPLITPVHGITSVDGLVHISELSWEKVDTIEEKYHPLQEVHVQVLGKDMDAKRIDLSIKRLTTDPFSEKVKNLSVDQKVSGTVSKIGSSSVLIDLTDGIEGIIRKEKIPPGVSFSEGEEVTVTVSQIDKDRRKVILVPILKEKPMMYR